jgi:S-DNA-T family DNA segregation ATPase FtsK/SpoIIIE
MVLGDEAYDRGARCDEISLDTPGIGYVVDDEDQRTPIRFRLDWHPDVDMRWLAAQYPSPTREDVPTTVGTDASGKAS